MMKYKIFGTVEKQDFFLKQINPVNLKKFFCTWNTIFEVSSCEQNWVFQERTQLMQSKCAEKPPGGSKYNAALKAWLNSLSRSNLVGIIQSQTWFRIEIQPMSSHLAQNQPFQGWWIIRSWWSGREWPQSNICIEVRKNPHAAFSHRY